ncbi:M14 family zinc carboxypeptidase [Sinosporangium siamense]|uniref:Peptidase M14 domain-containing protein n=1 Tax=Sinosporangium siamense TaxID=1367973 RepID=A0A919RK64_9ACTN|nr:M14 family zinc carboxypeptidase [Sinosporangium siamense]GII95332.1 hypothetical protein Ssi02_55630 [Sinosporangium siamense]
MTYPLEAIQPPAHELLDHDGVLDAMKRLAADPRVALEELGRSREGRAVNALVVARPDVLADPAAVRAAARRLSAPSGGDEAGRPWPEDLPVPVLLLAGNYGNEAAQTEALLEVADRLTADTDEAHAVLRSLVVLIVPLLNPDGRERALATWRERPRAAALTAYGNHYDIQVAREYLHLIEPESVALAELVRRWHPVLAWEVHEDSINLGLMFEETCLCPPMSPRGPNGTTMAGSPGDYDPRLFDQEVVYGAAIAEEWRSRDERLLHDPTGHHGWPRPVDPRFAHLAQHPETRFTRAMALRGVTAFITESARRPGTQTWEGRVRQKVSAGMAILRTAAAGTDTLTSIVRDAGRPPGAAAGEYFAIPRAQDAAVLQRALLTLQMHDVQVHATADHLVVFQAQARHTTLRTLLSLTHGRHQSLVATLGLQVHDSTDPGFDRSRIRPDDLTAVPQPSDWESSRFPWIASPPPPGALRPVGVYAGQGVKDFAAEGHLGGVRRLLDHEGIAYTLLEAGDVLNGALDDLDVLIVPNGDPDAVLGGSRPGLLWFGEPWQPEEEPSGLGADGADAVRRFVERGGHYIGVDGGAVLAGRTHMALLNCGVAVRNIGTGLVELAVHAPGDPVFSGVGGSWDESGIWRQGLVYAMSDCEAVLGEQGAAVLEAGEDADCLASFSRLLPVAGTAHLADVLPEGPPSRRAAILRGTRGGGTVTLFAVDPTYRSLSPYSARMLANAVRDRAARR